MGIKKSDDYFGADAKSLKTKKLYLFDMDGTIYKDNKLFDGTIELLETINKNGGKYIFITNNSSKSVIEYVHKVNQLGISASIENFFTSSQATILYLKNNFPNKSVFCQGTVSLIEELHSAGIDVYTEPSEQADVILVGFDTELTSTKIRNTCMMLQRDIPYIATNPDMVCPVSFGYVPDCGSICRMYECATGRTPIFIGKPEPIMVDSVRKKYGYTREETVVIGDRLYTDIAVGINAKVTTICVLSGEATVANIVRGDVKPTFTFESVKNIYDVLK